MNTRPLRKSLIALGVASALVTTSIGTADAATTKPPKPFKTTRIVVQKSEGGVALGASFSAVKKIFGSSHCATTPNFGSTCSYSGSNNSYDVYVEIPQGSKKVKTIQFQSGALAKATQVMRTGRNIHIGSTLAQAKTAYPDLKKSVGPGVDVYYYVLRQGDTETQFVFNGKKKLNGINMYTT